MYNKGDFYIHSNFSDGKFCVNELLDLYKKSEYDIVSITDHDTLEGCMEAIYGLNSPEDTVKFIDLCKQYKLLITGGSDFHDFNICSHSNIGDISLDNKNIENLLKFIESK